MRPLLPSQRPTAHRSGGSRFRPSWFCYSRLRWLLLISFLLLYLALFSVLPSTPLFPSSYSIPSPFIFLRKPDTSLPAASHAIAAESDKASSKNGNLLVSRSSIDPMSLRVYVYDLPPRYNTDWLSNPRCATHLFASEVAIHRAILNTPEVHTSDPWDADFFLVPVYVSCNFSTANGFPSLSHARELLRSAVQLVSSQHPFWNRSGGADHLFVASHDYGACFHAIEAHAAADGIPGFLNNSILLQTFGVNYPHPCQSAEHVVIPPYVASGPIVSRYPHPESHARDTFAYFRGKMEVHPKNVSGGHFYGRRVRTEIWRRYGDGRDRRFRLHRHRDDNFREEIARSTFCLCPRGWAPWSPRLVESVLLGCVPVVVADGIRLPFPEAVPWEEVAVRVPEGKVDRMGKVLGDIAAGKKGKTGKKQLVLSEMRRKLWDPAVRRALVYNRRIEVGDATWHVMRALTEKVGRSWSRSRRRAISAYNRDRDESE